MLYALLLLKYSFFLFNELYTVTPYFSKTVASDSPVHFMCVKKSDRSDLLTVRLMIHKIRCEIVIATACAKFFAISIAKFIQFFYQKLYFLGVATVPTLF